MVKKSAMYWSVILGPNKASCYRPIVMMVLMMMVMITVIIMLMKTLRMR